MGIKIMAVQFIETDSGRLAVLPEAEYRRLVDAAEDAESAAAIDRFRERLASGEEELVPEAIVARILAGENAIRAWRDHRGLSAAELATAANLSQAYISQIETGKRAGSIEAMKAIAHALRVTVDDLI
jgi:DNA-binding XRE family transcriptional regulator